MKAELQRDAVDKMLEELGLAVSSGELSGISRSYAFPALFLVDEKAMVIQDAEQIEKMFATGRESYISQGILSTRAELQEMTWLTEEIVTVDVRWPGFDSAGVENHTEKSYYLIQIVEGRPLIRVALTRTK